LLQNLRKFRKYPLAFPPHIVDNYFPQINSFVTIMMLTHLVGNAWVVARDKTKNREANQSSPLSA
jgi:hypothetical protein